jgi:hypothetical protein
MSKGTVLKPTGDWQLVYRYRQRYIEALVVHAKELEIVERPLKGVPTPVHGRMHIWAEFELDTRMRVQGIWSDQWTGWEGALRDRSD